jgi:hypothetical protein
MGDLASYSIYTMRHSSMLHEQAAEGGNRTLHERKTWRTGHRLWREAVNDQLPMPLIFSGAEANTGLIHWALIDAIEVDEGATSCVYSHLQPIEPPRPLSGLRLRSSGLPMSENYIRPYAICHTPDFIG